MGKLVTKPISIPFDQSKFDNSAHNDDTTPLKKGAKKPFITTGASGKGITPRMNAKKIESNAKKIEKLMGMFKGKATSFRDMKTGSKSVPKNMGSGKKISPATSKDQ